MGSIDALITGSVLGKPGSVFIDNAWDVLLAKVPEQRRKTRANWKMPGFQLTPSGLPDSCTYLPGTMDRAGYVRDGVAKFTKNKTFYGVCNDFTWVVTSVLVTKRFTGTVYNKQPPLLPAGTRVEVYGIVPNQDAKHLFTVVNRSRGSDENNFTTWGQNCFVVDQWYALQTETSPVKTLTQGPYYDDEFITWWNATVPGSKTSVAPGKEGTPLPNSFKPQMEFAAGEL
jgi:hypothetical protein